MKTKLPCYLLALAFSATTASPAPAADLVSPPSFEETFSLPLGNYWCENPLSVADLDGNGRQDIALMTPVPVVWVLHDEDPNYQTPPFHDTLTLLGDSGQVYLSKGGFNIAQTIGGSRMITTTDNGSSALICEFVARRMLKIDASGNVIFSVPGIWAVDVATNGTLFALDYTGTIFGSNILRISPQGDILDQASGGGMDLVVDDQNQGVFVVGADIKYFNFDLTGSWNIDPIAWTAVSVDVSSDGSAWIAEREHSQVPGSVNRLLRVSRFGTVWQTNDLAYSPSCVRVDRTDDSFYVTGDQLYKYDRHGALLFSVPLSGTRGWTLEIDANRQVWVGTRLDVRKFSLAGELLLTTSQFSRSSDTYIAAGRHSVPPPCSNCPPDILAQPFSRTNFVRSSTTFYAAASGTPPLLYQWLKDGAVIEGATNSSFTIARVQASDAGNYSVQVGNAFGSTASSNALLTVLERRDYFTEVFDRTRNDLAFQQFTFTPDGSADFYDLCREAATDFPTDPAGGISVALGDDNFSQVILFDGNTVSLYGHRTDVFFIGSNGYLTFNAGDRTYDASLAAHFRLPRIAALFSDLEVYGNGTVSWKQLPDRVAITFQNVPEYDTPNRNSFQIELFFDGRIRLTYLHIDSRYNLVGLSAGEGVPPDFQLSDLSAYGPCSPDPLSISNVTVTEGNTGSTDAVFTVSLATNHAEVVSVDFATADGTAIAGSDYLATYGTLIFNPGESIKFITVRVLGDVMNEGNETFLVRLSNPTNISLVHTQAIGTILDDDTAPPFFDEVFSYSLQEYWCENHLDVADMDGDGRKDIVLMATALANTNGPPWSYLSRAILLRAGSNGTFTDSVITNFPGRIGYGVFAAELNNDGVMDLILREQSATHVLLNDGHGGFEEVWTGQPGYYNLATVDVNHDGFLDIISGTQTGSGGLIELLTNNGAGTTFTKTWQSRYYGSGYDSIQTILNVNLNGDGLPDIAAREIYGGRLISLFGTNSGAPFIERSETYLGDRTFALAAGRVNGDALDDLAVHVGWGQVRVFANRGDGSMSNHWQSPNLGQAAFNLALADFDQDGFDDIFVGTFSDGALRIYRNTPGAGFETWWESRVPGAGYTGTAADVNGDGYPDLIVGEKNRLRLFINGRGHPLPISDVTVTEGNAGTTNAVFIIRLATNHSEVVSVDFATADGSAKAGSDYLATNGTLLFNPGETNKIVTVPVLGDFLDEADEIFFVHLSNLTNVSLIVNQATGMILDDDTALAITLQPTNQTVRSGSNATFSVSAASTFPPITYQWRLNGADIAGATNAVLIITNSQPFHGGLYSARVTDACMSVLSESARLIVLHPPEMIEPIPPLNLIAVPGDTVVLSATLRGPTPIFARWRRFFPSGLNAGVVADHIVNGETDFLVLTNVGTNHSGFYTLSLTNVVGGSLLPTGVRTNAYLTVLTDSDGDGLPDEWEVVHSLNPDDPNDANVDSDSDGLSNRGEYLAGTAPDDPQSSLKVDAIELADGTSTMRLRFVAVSNRTYTVQWRGTADNGSWNWLTDVVAVATNRFVAITDTSAPTNGMQRFYRLTTPRTQ